MHSSGIRKRHKKTHGGLGFQKFYFSNLLRLELTSLRYGCAAQWPILTKLPIFAKIYHPIELIGFSPNLERDLLEDFQITWKLISFISPRAFDEEGMRKIFWKCIQEWNDTNTYNDDHNVEVCCFEDYWSPQLICWCHAVYILIWSLLSPASPSSPL